MLWICSARLLFRHLWLPESNPIWFHYGGSKFYLLIVLRKKNVLACSNIRGIVYPFNSGTNSRTRLPIPRRIQTFRLVCVNIFWNIRTHAILFQKADSECFWWIFRSVRSRSWKFLWGGSLQLLTTIRKWIRVCL